MATEPLCRNTSWSLVLYEHISSLAPQFFLGSLAGALVGFSAGFATAATLILAYLGWRRISPKSKGEGSEGKSGKKTAWYRRHSPLHFLALASFALYWVVPSVVQSLLQRPAIDYLAAYALLQMIKWAGKMALAAHIPPGKLQSQEIKKKK